MKEKKLLRVANIPNLNSEIKGQRIGFFRFFVINKDQDLF
jgi:hypothetical protein